ncbi:MAG: heavy metal transporter [Winogradskyella sp.]|uniref:heavy-metal-associated domain-containing protein n=1 Tax=Winogradskyella sp. TaxID=1883156 RepID=UPI0017A7699F|nr:MauE/DoxX family redox-associated membrane protein [Winogradskyella sp.]MBT8244520.1 cation transporter [Winogradskyella sp.]NNK23962.1 heavy metal transporter [Winogradskyella sp.]
MTHIYKVTGMTCNGCKVSVEEKLSSISEIQNVSVSLEKSEAEVTMQKHVPVSELQSVLPVKYTITPKEDLNVFSSNAIDEEPKTEFQQLFPLLLIFGYILAASVLLNANPWRTSDFMFDFMGLFYVVFSFFKFVDYKGFPKSFAMYDPLAKAIPVYGWVYPFIEVVLGLAFLMRFQVEIALIITLIILGITTIGVTKALFSKKSIQCACLGTALQLPMTKATFIENTIMILMAIFMLLKIYSV